MTLANYAVFCFTCFALAIAPGPTVTVIIANALRSGMAAANRLIAGTVVGMLLWLTAATFGLSGAMNQSRGMVFDILRYAGAAYVIWLGFKLIAAKGGFKSPAEADAGRGYILQGFLVILSNPKMFVLYLVIIPPLLASFGSAASGTLLLGGTFVVIATLCDFAYALVSAKAGSWLMARNHLRTIELISGVFLVVAGLWLGLKHR